MYINYLKNAVLTIFIALLTIKILAFEKKTLFLGHPVDIYVLLKWDFGLPKNLPSTLYRDFSRTLQNTLAMSIGKFNFADLRKADEVAAWVFFAFSIVVNMILINMMMAIINLAFEDVRTKMQLLKERHGSH